MTLQELPYGCVIEFRKKRYFKAQGAAGDVLYCEKNGGMWFFIKGTHDTGWHDVDWKHFHVLYSPVPIKE